MSAPPPITSRKPIIPVVRALYDYNAQREDELSFQEGALLYVLEQDADWWKCRIGEKIGFVPSNYVGDNVEIVENPMHEAAKRGNVEMIEEMLKLGFSVNSLDKAGNTVLHWACRNGKIDFLNLILKLDPIFCQNKLGDTPLHCAAWGGYAEAVEILLQWGNVDVAITNKDDKTAYELAKNEDVKAALNAFRSTRIAYDEDADPESD